ncbi:hypothetical protein VFPPC_15478 [Pochonia chlamydosporia 170]|uniref:Uncharacterized protein n=1 Tax=Pochonia chlamydosporia 170 TaxID=1380566 RepID=A0A179FVU3_METCM|nr:hypothetical protein VFPPC_15478 [Pochonia chlamydosporia 170]OAQ69732.1 hypothetical protein VFPPC_15478 [Pochonia chlamydosporia 170]
MTAFHWYTLPGIRKINRCKERGGSPWLLSFQVITGVMGIFVWTSSYLSRPGLFVARLYKVVAVASIGSMYMEKHQPLGSTKLFSVPCVKVVASFILLQVQSLPTKSPFESCFTHSPVRNTPSLCSSNRQYMEQ